MIRGRPELFPQISDPLVLNWLIHFSIFQGFEASIKLQIIRGVQSLVAKVTIVTFSAIENRRPLRSKNWSFIIKHAVKCALFIILFNILILKLPFFLSALKFKLRQPLILDQFKPDKTKNRDIQYEICFTLLHTQVHSL